MTSIAFALAGLGGFNAHGAGFLAAATHRKIIPDLVTATSGQIVILSEWFRKIELKASVITSTLERNPSAQLTVALAGDPGVFRPAYLEAIMRWWTPPTPSDPPVKAILDRFMPAQVYVPTRSAADFQRIADALNHEAVIDGRPVGVVFNAYNLQTGEGVYFGNEAARNKWSPNRAIPNATESKLVSGPKAGVKEAELQPITAEAVRSALWLSLYGFDRVPAPHLVDGAYHRSCLVAELHTFDKLFVARPLAEGWLGHPPGNYFEVQDWQTEMWFSVAYKAEVDALHKINGLVKDGHLGDPFKVVDIYEVAPPTPAGYFNYFTERAAVFDAAHRQALERFDEAFAGAGATPP